MLTALAVSKGDTYLALGTHSGAVRILRLPEATLSCSLPPLSTKSESESGTECGVSEEDTVGRTPGAGAVVCLQFSPFRATQLAVGYKDGSVAVWDLYTRMPEMALHSKRHTGTCVSLAFSTKRQSTLFSFGSDGSLSQWDTAEKQWSEGRELDISFLAVAADMSVTVLAASLAPDDAYCALLCSDGNLRLFNSEDWQRTAHEPVSVAPSSVPVLSFQRKMPERKRVKRWATPKRGARPPSAATTPMSAPAPAKAVREKEKTPEVTATVTNVPPEAETPTETEANMESRTDSATETMTMTKTESETETGIEVETTVEMEKESGTAAATVTEVENEKEETAATPDIDTREEEEVTEGTGVDTMLVNGEPKEAKAAHEDPSAATDDREGKEDTSGEEEGDIGGEEGEEKDATAEESHSPFPTAADEDTAESIGDDTVTDENGEGERKDEKREDEEEEEDLVQLDSEPEEPLLLQHSPYRAAGGRSPSRLLSPFQRSVDSPHASVASPADSLYSPANSERLSLSPGGGDGSSFLMSPSPDTPSAVCGVVKPPSPASLSLSASGTPTHAANAFMESVASPMVQGTPGTPAFANDDTDDSLSSLNLTSAAEGYGDGRTPFTPVNSTSLFADTPDSCVGGGDSSVAATPSPTSSSGLSPSRQKSDALATPARTAAALLQQRETSHTPASPGRIRITAKLTPSTPGRPPRQQPSRQQVGVTPTAAPTPVCSLSAPESGRTAVALDERHLRAVLESCLQPLRADIHGQVQNLHVELLRQFHIQQMRFMERLDAQERSQQALIQELDRLKLENERLKFQLC